jgi:large subunit ribosomal protein L35
LTLQHLFVYNHALWVRARLLRNAVSFCYWLLAVPKLKTKSSAKKRFRFTATGKVRMSPAGKRHGMRKRPHDMLRDARGMSIMHPSDAKKVCSNYFHISRGG